MFRMIPSPFSADQEETQFMNTYGQMSGPVQQLIIAIVFLAILAAIVILRDMLKTTEERQRAH